MYSKHKHCEFSGHSERTISHAYIDYVKGELVHKFKVKCDKCEKERYKAINKYGVEIIL